MRTDSQPMVAVTIPSRAEFLHVIRTVVGSVAARHDLTIDAIEDLRIAVDEACAQLLVARGSAITVELSAEDGAVVATCRTDAHVEPWPPDGIEHSLGAQVLHGLADEVSWERTSSGPSVRVGKRAVGAGT